MVCVHNIAGAVEYICKSILWGNIETSNLRSSKTILTLFIGIVVVVVVVVAQYFAIISRIYIDCRDQQRSFLPPLFFFFETNVLPCITGTVLYICLCTRSETMMLRPRILTPSNVRIFFRGKSSGSTDPSLTLWVVTVCM